MAIWRKLPPVLALCAITALAGCGGVSVGLPGTTTSFGVGSPISTLRLSPSNCFLAAGAYGHRVGMNAAAIAGERLQQVRQLQSRFNLASSDVRAKQARWRSIVEGGC
ncbi:MAG: hypothetical protein GEU90_06305 [Gemmatimonas sp.]|nr:hypothetical protein [Gemmatimonas sp.]